MELSRRDFLKVTGASAAGAVLFNGCAVPEREMVLQSPALLPEDTVHSFENWYASVCRQCPAGCGIIVRVVEGRAKKIEGNPDHPLNRGKLCARGQAGLQDLYHPDRIRTPLRRAGPRGSGRYHIITWEDALDELVSRLQDQSDQGNADTVVLATEPLRGLNAYIANQFASTYGAALLAYEPMEQTVLHKVVKDVFGQDLLPVFDIEHADYILSFGANFLEPWLSQVSYNRAYGEFRQGRPGRRGYLVQVESRLSMTAANADEWTPINPGTEGVLALSIAYVLISEGLADPSAAAAMTGGAGAQALNAFRPEQAAPITGIAADRITAMAREFAKRRPSLAIGGAGPSAHTNGSFNLTAIYALNFLVGSVGSPGGVLFNPKAPIPELAARVPAATFADWWRLAERIRTKEPKPVNILMVHGANPLYGLLPSVGFGMGLGNVPVIVSFSSFMDETTAMADLIMPDHVYLEGWGDDAPDPGTGREVVGLQQPVVNPLYATRPFADVLLTAARGLGGEVQKALPWDTHRDALRAVSDDVFNLRRGSVRAPDSDSFWNGMLQRGGWWDLNAASSLGLTAAPALTGRAPRPSFAGPDTEFPLHLTIFPSNGMNDGRGAHLPWLQMAPDPTTTVSWQSWVEVNPKTAANLGVQTNDIVTVVSPSGRLEVPVYVYPAIHPDVVAMPAGQGHTYMGRYAERRGSNALSILAPLTDEATGALAWGATRVRLERTGRQYRLPKLEGSAPAVQPEDYSIIQITDLRSK